MGLPPPKEVGFLDEETQLQRELYHFSCHWDEAGPQTCSGCEAGLPGSEVCIGGVSFTFLAPFVLMVCTG